MRSSAKLSGLSTSRDCALSSRKSKRAVAIERSNELTSICWKINMPLFAIWSEPKAKRFSVAGVEPSLRLNETKKDYRCFHDPIRRPGKSFRRGDLCD